NLRSVPPLDPLLRARELSAPPPPFVPDGPPVTATPQNPDPHNRIERLGTTIPDAPEIPPQLNPTPGPTGPPTNPPLTPPRPPPPLRAPPGRRSRFPRGAPAAACLRQPSAAWLRTRWWSKSEPQRPRRRSPRWSSAIVLPNSTSLTRSSRAPICCANALTTA